MDGGRSGGLDDIVAYFDGLSVDRDQGIEASVTVAYEQAMRHRFVRECVERAGPRRVLDVGCGNGRDVIPLARTFGGLEALGVDVSGGMVAEARRGLAVESDSVRRRVRFEVADLARPGAVAPGAFDFVVCSEVLEHVPDWPGMLANIRTALVPGGFAVVTLPNRSSCYGIDRWLVERWNAHRGKQAWPHPYDEWKTAREVLAVSRAAGFRPVLERGACYLPGFTLFAKAPLTAAPAVRAVGAAEPVLRRIAPRRGYMYCVLLESRDEAS